VFARLFIFKKFPQNARFLTESILNRLPPMIFGTLNCKKTSKSGGKTSVFMI